MKREDEDVEDRSKGSSESAEVEGREDSFRPSTGLGITPLSTPATTTGFGFDANETLSWYVTVCPLGFHYR